MRSSHYTLCKHIICFGLALLLGISAMVIMVPLMRSKTMATPDPLAVSDTPYTEVIPSTKKSHSDTSAEKENYIDWNAWVKTNSDIAGWLTIPTLKLSLPIVQARQTTPLFYLDHDVYGNENIYGCPFIDADCADEGLAARHVIIMGHSLTDGSIFTPLLKYADEAFAEKHSEIRIYTPKNVLTYTVRRASIVPGDTMAKSSAFECEDAFSKWLFEEDARALYTLNTAPATCGLSLVTCSYFKDPANERFVLFCTPKQEDVSLSAQSISEPHSPTLGELPRNQPSGLIKLPDTGPAVWKATPNQYQGKQRGRYSISGTGSLFARRKKG